MHLFKQLKASLDPINLIVDAHHHINHRVML
jgi:hypothetical protein